MPTATAIVGRIFAVLVLLMFAVTSWTLAMRPNDSSAVQPWGVGSTIALTVLLLGWFLFSFTGKDKDKSESMFIFAYVFTFISLALLILPPMGDLADQTLTSKNSVTNDHAPASNNLGTYKDSPIEFFRGCVDRAAPADSGISYPSSMWCSKIVEATLPTEKNTKANLGARDQRPIQKSSSPDDKKKERADANGQRPPEKATSADQKYPAIADGSSITATRIIPDRYMWLASLGSVMGKSMDPSCELDGNTKAGADARATADDGKSDRSTNCGARKYTVVLSGLAVPLYVVILALVGGAVSLSRRIPEYQKRCDEDYIQTPDAPAMSLVQARESVVFQIMQLISAPFIAIAAYYIIGPSTLATAAALAFGCGFASEPILMMIRGVITALRPESTKMQVAQKWAVSGTVVDSGGTSVPNASVSVIAVPSLSAMSDGLGAFALANVPQGQHILTATAGSLQGSANIQVLNADLRSVVIHVAAAAAANAKLSGRVLDPAGATIAGASVTVDGTALTTTSAADGGFALLNVPLGPQAITVGKAGRTATTSVTVQAAGTVVDLTLA